MKYIQSIIPILILTSLPILLKGQTDSTLRISERLLLDIPLFDLPFLKYAATAASNKAAGQSSEQNVTTNINDYLRSYENLSMNQSTAITRDLHYTNYYFQNKLWNHLIEPTTKKKRIVNRLAANVSSGIVDYLLAYQVMIFSPVWLHEEFHRSGLSFHGISSHNDTYYRFTNRSADAGGSITKVLDADLIRFKQIDPVGMVRSFESGIESQYLLLRNMQKDNFFQKLQYPNIAMNILLTNAAVNYVNQFKRDDYDSSIDSMNLHGVQIADRDFVGWDFTAWVYDMFRPEEPYADRGTHPLGNGINRIIKRSALTEEEDAYLVKMGNLQYLNYFSPALIGINRIKLNEETWFNFAFRQMLTSFGYDLSLDIFLDRRGKQWMVGLHNYQNKNHRYAGIEIERQQLSLQKHNIDLSTRVMFWVQPKNERFYATESALGGLLGIRAERKFFSRFDVYLELEGKTNGWVAGNPYLGSNISFRTGLSLDINDQ